MKADFNGIRLNMAYDFNRFAKQLNVYINADDSDRIVFGKYNQELLLDKFEILRNSIWSLMCMYDNEAGYRDISEEIPDLELINLPEED